MPGSSKNTDWSFINVNILEMNECNGFDQKALYLTPGKGMPVLQGTLIQKDFLSYQVNGLYPR